MNRLGWVVSASLAAALSIAGGAAWWIAVGDHNDAIEASGPSIDQTSAAPTGDEIFTGEQLSAFLLDRDDLDVSTGLTMDFQTPTDRYVQRTDDYTPTECRFADGSVVTYPAGYRGLVATSSADAANPSMELRQDVFQFPTVRAAEEAAANIRGSVDSCNSFVGGWSAFESPTTMDFTVTPISAPSSSLPILAWTSQSVGQSPTLTSWISLRFGNVVTIVAVTSPADSRPGLDESQVTSLMQSIETTALNAARGLVPGASPAPSISATAPACPASEAPVATEAWPTLTRGDMAASAIPAVCDHAAGTLMDGKLPGIQEGYGAATLTDDPEQLAFRADPRAGQVAAAVVVHCDMGGVAWPDNIVFYDRDRAVLGLVDLGSLTGGYRDPANRVWFEGESVRAEWFEERASLGNTLFPASARFDWDGSQIAVSEFVVGTTPAEF